MTAATIELVPRPASRPAEPAFLARIRLRARRHVLWLDHLWASAPGGTGLAISPHEVHRILAGTTADVERAFHDGDPEARALGAEIAELDARHAADPMIVRLRDALGLSEPELDLLTLAVALEADPWLRRAFGYIHDDATSTLPTPWLARQLFHWPAGTRIGPDAALVRWRLASPAEPTGHAWSAWSVGAAWLADPLIASALIHGGALDTGLGDAVRLAPTPPAACLYAEPLAAALDFVRALAPAALQLAIAAPHGAGKRTFAAQLCAALGRPLLVVDAGAILRGHPEPAARDAIVRVIRSARLTGAAVYWHDADALSSPGVAPPALAILGTTRTVPAAADDGVIRRTVRLPALTQAARAALWARLSSRPVPAPVLEWPLLPSDIARAAALAPAGPEAMLEACRGNLRIDAAALAAPLTRPYSWDDLVVPPSVRRHLEELESQARLRWPVYEGWGFGKHFPMGRGIAALFAGPSGTGKTMAAQVLARALDMELYRVDLAGVMSKYIGETEKNLRQVFDACERANVLLFFDEADALFGQRMQVKDAHDRFANVEIDYLLQRMEQFDGLAVLATNRKHEIDGAFLRRVRFIIDFLPPAIAERRELWRRALPPRTPNGDDLLDAIDFAVLGERLEMTGADIKNAATSAAFLARAEGSRIAMRHVVRAARRELAKRGIVLRAGELE